MARDDQVAGGGMVPLRHPPECHRTRALSHRRRDQAAAPRRRLRRFVEDEPDAPHRKNGRAAEPRHLPHGRRLRVALGRDHRRRRRGLSRHGLGRLLHRARLALGRGLGKDARDDQGAERQGPRRSHDVMRDLLDTAKPLALAPMGSVSGGALAAAVSRAGGRGLIGAGYGGAQGKRRELDRGGDARVGSGFITWRLAKQPQLLHLALEHKPSAVMLSFGDPRPFAAKIKHSGAKLICQVQSLATARQPLAAGADLLVAQGTEAGGHGGERSLFALLPAVRDLTPAKPLLAAGGIADRRGYEAALALGAAGVLVGTRFIAAEEALATPAAKKRVVEASGDATLRTTAFDAGGGYAC